MDRMTSIAPFVKIAETGGFASAARKLGISPSTVTMQIQDLEHASAKPQHPEGQQSCCQRTTTRKCSCTKSTETPPHSRYIGTGHPSHDGERRPPVWW
jgi:hypothetical protein